jgi:predicted ArsR family transcriptional regulator
VADRDDPRDDGVQRQARALGDPTRHGIFIHLMGAGRPLGVAELTEHVGLHHNAIRQHLAKLVDAGLVREDTERSARRGRPRLTYTVAPAAGSRWGAVGPYERLALMLTEVIRTDDPPIEVGRRAGRRERLGAGRPVDPVGELVERMARHGFEPSLARDRDEIAITLQACPFASAAMADPDTICQLHLGLAYGVADEVGGLVIDELIPRDPRHARCQLRAHVVPAAPGP